MSIRKEYQDWYQYIIPTDKFAGYKEEIDEMIIEFDKYYIGKPKNSIWAILITKNRESKERIL